MSPVTVRSLQELYIEHVSTCIACTSYANKVSFVIWPALDFSYELAEIALNRFKPGLGVLCRVCSAK